MTQLFLHPILFELKSVQEEYTQILKRNEA